MKTSRLHCCPFFCSFICIAFLLFPGCDITDPTKDFNIILNIDVDKEIYSGTMTGEPSTLEYINNVNIGPGTEAIASLSKTSAIVHDEYRVELGTSWDNVYETFLVSASGYLVYDLVQAMLYNANLEDVIVDVYLGFEMTPLDPTQTDRVKKIGQLTLQTSEHSYPTPEDFTEKVPTNEVLTWYKTNIYDKDTPSPPGSPVDYRADKCFLYLYFTSDPNINVVMRSVTMALPATSEIVKRVTSGDLADYAILDIYNAEIKGTLTNNGTAPVTFFAKMRTSSTPAGDPSTTIGSAMIPALGGIVSNVIDLATEEDFLDPGMAATIQQVFTELANGIITWIEFDIKATSSENLILQVDNLSLFGRIKGTAE